MRKQDTDSMSAARRKNPISPQSADTDIMMPSAPSSSSIQAKSGKGVLRRTSMPTTTGTYSKQRQMRRHSTIGSLNVVKRQRRLSTEAHPSQMFESMFNGDATLDLEGPQFCLDMLKRRICFPS